MNMHLPLDDFNVAGPSRTPPVDGYPVEQDCAGIPLDFDEVEDSVLIETAAGLTSGFQHDLDHVVPRTDSATTVHSFEELIAEAG